MYPSSYNNRNVYAFQIYYTFYVNSGWFLLRCPLYTGATLDSCLTQLDQLYLWLVLIIQN